MATCSSKFKRNATSEEAACNPCDIFERNAMSEELERNATNEEAAYNPNDIWGNVFVFDSDNYCDFWGNVLVLDSDSGGIGSESIHFVSNDENGNQGVYLSFEHPRYRSMTLFDGKPWPLKVPIKGCHWAANTRTFKGWVKFQEHCGSGVTERSEHRAEAKTWYFWLIFDGRFQRVINGCKRIINGSSDSLNRINYGAHHDYTYYNAAIQDPLIGIKGCTIDDAAYRGITLPQLLDMKQTIRCRCVSEKWRSTNLNLSNKLLEPKDVTLYDLVEHLIKPITETRQCSFVEIIANKPQPPKWFVSHWWGEPVIDFIECLEGHARDRGLGLDTSYWICAFANNQWNADEEIGENANESSFYRAMKLSEGTVSILDRRAVCYTRIWCTYERYLSFVEFSKDRSISDNEESPHLYDAYTIGQNEEGKTVVVGLTDGPVALDNDGVRSQANRQNSFPLEIVNNALKVKINNAEASKPQDKTHILNSICGNEQCLKAEPPANHVKYDAVDSLLRGRFASSIYRRILDSGQNLDLIRKALSEASLSRVGFSFSGCKRFRDEASKFALSIPESLQYLDLDYAFTQFHSSEEFAVGFRRLRNLKMLKLSLHNSMELSCINNLGKEIGFLAQLVELDLDIGNTKITKCGALAEMLNNLSELEILRINFAHTSISDISDLSTSLATMTNVEKLTLDMKGSSLSNEEIIDICQSVVKLNGLDYLRLDLSDMKSAFGMVQEKLVGIFQNVDDVKTALKRF